MKNSQQNQIKNSQQKKKLTTKANTHKKLKTHNKMKRLQQKKKLTIK